MQIEQGVYALCRVGIIEEGVYALCRVGGWYKILGRSESLAVKKPSNRGGCDACSGAHRLSEGLHNNIMEVNKGEG